MSDSRLVLSNVHLHELPEVAHRIIRFAGQEKLWLFNGPMGAGKTTIIKAICQAFEVQDAVSSPTFALVNEYKNHRGETFYHFDFYRIQGVEEAIDIGVNDYFYSGNHCFVEWPSNIAALLPEKYLSIRVEATAEDRRSIYLEKHE